MKSKDFNELAVQLCEAAKEAIIKDVRRITRDFNEFVLVPSNIGQLERLKNFGNSVYDTLESLKRDATGFEDDYEVLDDILSFLNEPTIYNIFKTEERLNEFKKNLEIY